MASSSPPPEQGSRRRGGWVTFPFIAGNIFGLSVGLNGAVSNFIVYLINHFNVKAVNAAQIFNIINGFTSLAPIVGAILSDSYFGCFRIVVFSSIVSVLSTLMFTLTAAVPGLWPPHCPPRSGSCQPASAGQLAVLYGAVALLCVGNGGTRFNSMAMGASQFDEPRDRDVFFNWYLVILSVSTIIASTVVVYVQENVSWAMGFGVCMIGCVLAVAILLLGVKCYRQNAAQGSPFTDMLRVVVAAATKRKLTMVKDPSRYYHQQQQGGGAAPTGSFSFLNRAALITEGDTNEDGSVARPWLLCTVAQVEDLKTVIRILPLLTSNIFITVCIATQGSLSILQARTMDRALSPRFSVPAASLMVISLATNAISLTLLDRVVYPTLSHFAGISPTPLQRIGFGCVANVASMGVSAIVELKRAAIVHAHNAESDPAWTVPLSVLWLLLPLAITGLGEAMHFPGQIAFYYQEFPKSLKSTATGMIALVMALGFYVSTAVVDIVRRITGWLPDNINDSKLDNVYWLLALMGTMNLGYFILCAKLYKHQSPVEKVADAAEKNLEQVE